MPEYTIAAIILVFAVTMLVSLFGLRVARSTSDFYVASRRVSPRMNASALAGEYISAASFLGVAGLIVAEGTYGLWFPLGYTAGCLTMLLFMTGPLRRSGVYTVPDFVSLRFSSARLRVATVIIVVLTGWLYIVPQLHGAALALTTTTGLPGWAGPVAVILVVLATVLPGGMRSVTIAQAVQYWIKLSALLVPLIFILLQAGALGGAGLPGWDASVWDDDAGSSPADLYRIVSLLLALMLGTIGLPHILVRFYTNPDGDAARRTTFLLLGLLSGFYVLPVALGVIARAVLPDQGLGSPDTALLRLPAAIFEGVGGDLLTAVIAGGAFAAFLSTSSGLVVSVSGVLSQEFFGGSVRGFRIGAVLACALPLAIATATTHMPLAGTVAMVFTFAGSSLAPLLLLGIWWSGITAQGAVAGMVTGAAASLGSFALGWAFESVWSTEAVLLDYPALWCVPLAFAVAVLVSRFGTSTPPANTAKVLARLHLPEG